MLNGSVATQEFPAHAIRLVIPYPPGGIVDAVGRPWADKMKSLLGTVVVANMRGDVAELRLALATERGKFDLPNPLGRRPQIN
jgi:tripartite-type tricarboxylate transporter receptor subunit TctC